MASNLIHVAAAAIEDSQGRILITKRHDHVHQGGLWEFPGGKLEPQESVMHALTRELQEELGITPLRPEPLIRITHHYEDCSVLLDVYRVKAYLGNPRGMEGQPLDWLLPEQMQADRFPAADRPILSALQLPDRYLITGDDPFQQMQFLRRLERSLLGGLRLVQLRAHPLPDADYRILAEEAWMLCQRYGARLLLNRPGDPQRWADISDGIHLTRHQLMSMAHRPEGPAWVGASCHDPVELHKAGQLGLDYVLLSPVQSTLSHPEATAMGWEQFSEWVNEVNLPVYALGGLDIQDLSLAKQKGAQGIAGISGFWPGQAPNP